MSWYIYISHFVGALFLVNALPHFIQGVSGSPFQSPFAKPPGIGESSPSVNVLWGFFNFLVGYGLLLGVGDFTPGLTLDTLLTCIGALAAGLLLSRHFGQVRNKKTSDNQ